MQGLNERRQRVKTVLLLRHASAENGPNDKKRPLTKEGRRQASSIGRWMAKRFVPVDAIFTSSAKRAAQTAELCAEAAGYEEEIQETDILYDTDISTYLESLKVLENEIRVNRHAIMTHLWMESASKIDPPLSVLYSVGNRAEGGLRGDACSGDHSQDSVIGPPGRQVDSSDLEGSGSIAEHDSQGGTQRSDGVSLSASVSAPTGSGCVCRESGAGTARRREASQAGASHGDGAFRGVADQGVCRGL